MRQPGEEGLLAPDPVEVTVGQPVALADEGQGVVAGHGARPGREARAGLLVVDRVLEADVDAADRLGELEEAEEVDLGVVVDGQAR